MEKLGYVILISIYFISFSIGKSFSGNDDLAFLKVESISNKYVLESMAKDAIDAVGMDDFFYYLNKGL